MTPDTTDELERLTLALDELRMSEETYRQAWLRAEKRAERLEDECQRLRRQVGREDSLNAREIARLAGREPITVETWVYRHKDGPNPFPKPLPDITPREWARVEIMEWLRKTGRMPDE